MGISNKNNNCAFCNEQAEYETLITESCEIMYRNIGDVIIYSCSEHKDLAEDKARARINKELKAIK